MDDVKELNNRLMYSFTRIIKEKLHTSGNAFIWLSKNFVMFIDFHRNESIYTLSIYFIDDVTKSQIITKKQMGNLMWENFETQLIWAYKVIDDYKGGENNG